MSTIVSHKHNHLLRGHHQNFTENHFLANLHNYFLLDRSSSNFCKLTREFGKLMLENRMHPNGVHFVKL